MNCISQFSYHSSKNKDKVAFVSPNSKPVTFNQVLDYVCRIQFSLNKLGIKKGDSILIAHDVCGELYSLIIASLGLGITVVLVEPWMPINKISESISIAKPKIFVASFFGKIWGSRVKEIRKIPIWSSISSLISSTQNGITIVPVEDNHPGIITFTSGTSGKPKGVVREQGYLVRQFQVLKDQLHFDQLEGAELTIFANWTLLNLNQGRTTVYFPNKWSRGQFKWLNEALKRFKVESLTCGPAFINELSNQTSYRDFKEIHVGGALIACKSLEKIIETFPLSKIYQIYGSSEVEPVCLIDAKTSITESRNRHYYHSLFLGKPIEQIDFENTNDGMWVTGPHVCPFYLNNSEDNLNNKKKDQKGKIWHFMGDRILIENDEWIYSGRSFQESGLFFLEQKIYHLLNHDQAFIHRTKTNRLFLIGENILKFQISLQKVFPEIDSYFQTKIIKDVRHRSRIDRVATIQKLKGKFYE